MDDSPQAFTFFGDCPTCDRAVSFSASNTWFRDHLVCTNCGSIPRERALMSVIEQLYPNWRTLQIHESSPIARGASVKLKSQCPGYIASQYLPSFPKGGDHPLGFRNENLEEQTFESERFDLVVTQDVFEHLFDPIAAIKEISRTLRPGGAHICTVPIVLKNAPSKRRASIDGDGRVIHHVEPQYHGNPLDDRGSLVTIDWGYDIACHLSAASGLVSTIFKIDDISRGIRAEYIEVLVNQKPPSKPLHILPY